MPMEFPQFPEEHELISVFECIPRLTDEGIPFVYNGATYEFVNQTNEQFIVDISPAYGDIRILVTDRETQQALADLNFKQASALEIVEDNRTASKVAINSERQRVIIQMKPRFVISIEQDDPNQ